MDRDLKREYMARGSTLATIVVVHASIIFALVTHMLTVHSGNIPEAILVTVVDKPLRPPEDLSYPRLKWNRWIPVLLPESMPHVSVPVYQEPAPILEGSSSAQTAPNAPSTVVNPSYIGLKTSGGDSNLEGGKHSIPVIHYVQPIYPAASVRAREQGYVIVRALIDKRGRAKTVEVVRSSGFRRLDEATVDAIRWWKFAPTRGSDDEVQTTIEMEFELSPPNLSSLPVVVMPFDPAMARQMKSAGIANSSAEAPIPGSAQALGELIEKIRTFESSHRRPAGPIPPIQLLASWGTVLSIRFIGSRNQGLDIEFEQGVPRNQRQFQWEHFEVKQVRGASEWLIAVSHDGAIQDVQGMICAPAGDSASGCPWR